MQKELIVILISTKDIQEALVRQGFIVNDKTVELITAALTEASRYRVDKILDDIIENEGLDLLL